MKQPNAERPWICKLCGKVKEQKAIHLNSHRHKANMKKIEDAMTGEPIKHVEVGARWQKP